MPLQSPAITAGTPMQPPDSGNTTEGNKQPRIPLPPTPAPPGRRRAAAEPTTDNSGRAGASGGREYIYPLRGTNPAAEKLRQYVNDKKAGKVVETNIPLGKAELNTLQSFVTASRKLRNRERALMELGARCRELLAETRSSNRIERADEPGGVIAEIRGEAQAVKELLETMIEQNGTVRYDQIDNLYVTALPARNEMSLLTRPAQASSSDEDVEQMRNSADRQLRENLENVSAFLEFLSENRKGNDLFDAETEFDINKRALEAASEFVSAKSLVLGDRAVSGSDKINLDDVKAVVEKSLRDGGASNAKIIFIRDILIPLQYLFNRKKFVVVNSDAIMAKNAREYKLLVDAVRKNIEEYVAKKEAEATQAAKDDEAALNGLFGGE